VHLFGFIIRIYHDTRSSECQIHRQPLKSRVGIANTTENTYLSRNYVEQDPLRDTANRKN
jgi:hypothetical protein